MKEEIVWLCGFLDIPYQNENSLILWQIAHRSCEEKQIGSIYYNIQSNQEQLTMFDYDILEAEAI